MFSKSGTYPAVGLFSATHIIAIIVCFSLIALVVVLTRHMRKETYLRLLKILAIVFTCTELFKIIWSISTGSRDLNAWLPLYFCSIFIYALWFIWSKNAFVREMGLSFIAFAGIIAGAVFIVSPSTSFNTYPIFHFQCIYSMIYHSTMVYSGCMLFVTKTVRPSKNLILKYCTFCGIFMLLAIIINSIFGSNLMFFNDPSGVPISFLFTIYNFSHIAYTLFMVAVHLSLSLIVTGIYYLAERIISNFRNSKEPAGSN